MSDAAEQLIRAFSSFSPSERHAVMLELAKISESETELSDEDLAGVGDELFGMYMMKWRTNLAAPKKGEVWLVDMGYTAKTRPAVVVSIALTGNERAITTVVPHTTSERGTRFEVNSDVRWLKDGVFDVQGIGTYPTVKLSESSAT